MPQQILGTTVQKTDDAVGIFRNDQEKKHWYVAVVNNRSEKACQDRLRKRLKNETDSEKAYEVYVPIQQEMRFVMMVNVKKWTVLFSLLLCSFAAQIQ